MLAFPSGKVNLGLSITEKHPDRYRNLGTILYPIPTEDVLGINLLHGGSRKYCPHQADIEIAGEAENNLVVKAYKLLDELFDPPPVGIHLFRHIPSRAGLGGGSADAAFMLRPLSEKFNLGLSIESMEDYASRLDADCVFFIRNAPTYTEGTDNVFSLVSLLLKGFQLWLVKPGIFASTRDAFSQIKPHRPERPLKETTQLPVGEWGNCMMDNFGESVFPQFPATRKIREEIYRQGAVYTSMSDLSSSVYGMLKPSTSSPDIDFGKEALVYKGKLVV